MHGHRTTDACTIARMGAVLHWIKMHKFKLRLGVYVGLVHDCANMIVAMKTRMDQQLACV
jgi:hypothetical protein